MEEANNKIEMNFLNSTPIENKKEEVVAKPKRKPEEKSALKSGNKTQVAKAPVQRVKIAPYAYVEVSSAFLCTLVCKKSKPVGYQDSRE